MCYIRRLTSSPLHPTTEDLLFMTNFNQAKRLQLTPLLSNSAHLVGGSDWMYGGRHERKNLLSDKTHTHANTVIYTDRPSEETSSKKTLIPSSTHSPHTTLQSSVPSLILSSQTPPLFHISLLLLTVYTFFKISVKSSRFDCFCVICRFG